MGLDQTVSWFGKPSKDEVARWKGRNISCEITGMNWTEEPDEEKYKNVRKFMVPQMVKLTRTNWDLIKIDCGHKPEDHICAMGGNSITFGRAVNIEPTDTHYVNWMDKKYKYEEDVQVYFWKQEEVYRWHGRYDIQGYINKLHPDVYCERKDEYETVYAGYYPITKAVYNKLKKFGDCGFMYEKNLYYGADW